MPNKLNIRLKGVFLLENTHRLFAYALFYCFRIMQNCKFLDNKKERIEIPFVLSVCLATIGVCVLGCDTLVVAPFLDIDIRT